MKTQEYKEWLEQQIEATSEDKDMQREHWAFCKAYEKLTNIEDESIFIHFYKQIEDPVVRERAIKNYDPEFYKAYKEYCKVKTLGDALAFGFDWAGSPEKSGYWIKIYDSL